MFGSGIVINGVLDDFVRDKKENSNVFRGRADEANFTLTRLIDGVKFCFPLLVF